MHEALRHQRFADSAWTRKQVRMRGPRRQLVQQAMVNLAMAAQRV
jgi:hypothetical protein